MNVGDTDIFCFRGDVRLSVLGVFITLPGQGTSTSKTCDRQLLIQK